MGKKESDVDARESLTGELRGVMDGELVAFDSVLIIVSALAIDSVLVFVSVLAMECVLVFDSLLAVDMLCTSEVGFVLMISFSLSKSGS